MDYFNRLLLMPMEKLSNETEMLRLLVEGHESALRYVYDRYCDRVYQVAMKFLKSPELAQEIVQDVFLKLWQNRTEIDTSRPIEAWLYTVAKNHVFNQFKKLAREHAAIVQKEMPADAPDRQPGADARVIENEVEKLLHEAINRLPDKQKEVYRLARLEGYSRNEIAVHLKVSSLTVKTHMSRAIISVKNFLMQKGVSTGYSIVQFLAVVFFQ